MELNDKDREFAERLRQTLRQSERTLDKDTTARLRIAREQAVATAQKPRWALNWLVPAGAVAAGLLVFAWLPMQAPVLESSGMDSLEILADEMGPEFYQDLEFYEWLETRGVPA